MEFILLDYEFNEHLSDLLDNLVILDGFGMMLLLLQILIKSQGIVAHFYSNLIHFCC